MGEGGGRAELGVSSPGHTQKSCTRTETDTSVSSVPFPMNKQAHDMHRFTVDEVTRDVLGTPQSLPQLQQYFLHSKCPCPNLIIMHAHTSTQSGRHSTHLAGAALLETNRLALRTPRHAAAQRNPGYTAEVQAPAPPSGQAAPEAENCLRSSNSSSVTSNPNP